MPRDNSSMIPQAVGLGAGAEGADVAMLQDYLRRFGYLAQNGHGTVDSPAAAAAGVPEPARFDASTVSALRAYQRFHGLPPTGVLDDATVAMMGMPRCGVPDLNNGSANAAFVAQGNRWETTDLRFAFRNFTPDLTEAEVRAAVAAAFALWSELTPLTFTEVPLAQNPEIVIQFAEGDHGDGANNAFDGGGGVLAHAFFPPPNGGDIAGDAHFDDAEIWSVTVPVPTGRFDLVTVAAHEFGHSLGLDHTTVAGALMFPTHSGPQRFLHDDDRAGIQSIYGAPGPKLAVANFGYDAGGWRVERHPRFLADITGDGRADIVGFGGGGVWISRAQPDGTFAPLELAVANFGYDAGGWRVERHPRFLADITGDGRADIVGFGGAGVWISRAQPDGTFAPLELAVANFGYDAGGWRVERHPRFLADITGDGRADIVGFGGAGVWISRAQPDGTFAPLELAVANFGYDAGGWRVERHPRFLADITGDGRADIVGFGGAGVYVALSNGDGTFGPIERVIDNFGYGAGGWRVDMHPRFLADTTGDGRADIVGFGGAGVYVALSNGDGTFGPIERVIDNFGYGAGGWRVERHPRFLADTTGDGRADIVGFGGAGVYVALSNGDGTFGPIERVIDNFGYGAGGWRVERHPRFLADTTGDGRADVVGCGNAGVWISRAQADGSFAG